MWHKSGDFSKKLNSGADLRQLCMFKQNDADSIVHEIFLLGYEGGSYRIEVKFNSPEMTDNFINQVGQKLFIDTSNRFVWQEKIAFSSENLNQLHLFLQELRGFAPVTNEIYIDICSELSIEPLETNLNVILSMPLDEACKQLLESQSYKLYDTIWDFCKALYQDSLEDAPQYSYDSQQLYDLLNLVSDENPYYGQAQDLIVELLIRTVRGSNETRDDVKLKFRHALNGTDQWLTDQLYKELCGQAIGSEFTTNVRGDADTLINLADRFLQMSQQLKLGSNTQGFFVNQLRNEPTNLDSINANTI